MNFRKLTEIEIEKLLNQNCHADNWENINVLKEFDTTNLNNTRFSGNIYLENFKKAIKSNTGIIKNAGIFNSTVHNCYISANSLINNVKLLANYKIGENAIIENVNNLIVSGETSFGNGTELEILNEGGGRELKIYDKLSSQLAYLIVTKRNKTEFIDKINVLITNYAESVKSSEGSIGNNSAILNCNYICNVKIGSYAKINGIQHLEDGTIDSNQQAPVKIGERVIAKSFIILSGSTVDGAAMLDKTFVGQGVKIGKQYSAENSAFFANCESFHGEACSLFAGPYTVTHHKSTLLIAGLFSFYNAGSGSNQSNHLYKLGPVHQGILERGAKTGSFSYMMWPSRVGAFTGVIGKHYSNFDATNFPFSYILESGGKSLLMPAMNLCTVGTKRDSVKWPKRDRRKDSLKYDRINFELFNPYIISKIVKGIEQLQKILNFEDDQSFIEFEGLFIKKSKIKDAIEKYKMAIDIYIGDEIYKLIDNSNINSFDKLKEIINTLLLDYKNIDTANWTDVSGMFAPTKLIDELLDLTEIEDIERKLNNIFENYDKLSANWCFKLLEKLINKPIIKFEDSDLTSVMKDWKNAKINFNNFVLEDAKKEFSNKIKIGFGIDGDQEIKNLDFEAVRGNFDNNSFVNEIQSESENIEKSVSELLNKLQLIK